MAGSSQRKTTGIGWQTERLVPHNLPWHKKRLVDEHAIRYQFAAPYVKGKTVIDLACGVGFGCEILSENSKSVIGVDINAEAISYAKKNYLHKNIEYVKSDVTKTSFPKSSFDVVTSFETIEHLTDDKAFISEVHRLLKPNGLFIMSTPNVEFSVGTNPYHVREYTFSECLELLKDFKSVKVFGQRKVFRPMFNVLKNFPVISSFRPWENVDIHPLSTSADTNYCYFIFVCQ